MDPNQPIDQAQPVAASQVPTPKKSGALKWVIIVLLVLLVLGAGAYFLMFKSKTANLPPISNSPTPSIVDTTKQANDAYCGKLISKPEIERAMTHVFTDTAASSSMPVTNVLHCAITATIRNVHDTVLNINVDLCQGSDAECQSQADGAVAKINEDLKSGLHEQLDIGLASVFYGPGSRGDDARAVLNNKVTISAVYGSVWYSAEFKAIVSAIQSNLPEQYK